MRKPWHYIVSGYYSGEPYIYSRMKTRKGARVWAFGFVSEAEMMDDPSSKVELVIPWIKKRFTILEARMI